MPPSNPRWSIIIPLEFHRGVGTDCLAKWAELRQAGNQFELILAAPESMRGPEAQTFTKHIDSTDQILFFPEDHDMDLVASGAKYARGEWLFFTESHVMPTDGLLEAMDREIAAHPEWDGFSCRSIPIIHNLLSKIEAEMYNRHIKGNLQQHPWLKVLDQCFAIKRQAYEAVGGFEAVYGHFAEWVFAARLKLAGYTLGYADRAEVRHYFAGNLRDLEKFTLDWGQGEAIFHTQNGQDPARALFPVPPIVNAPPHALGDHNFVFLRLATRAFVSARTIRDGLQSASCCLRFAMAALFGTWWLRTERRLSTLSAAGACWFAQARGKEAPAREWFLRFMAVCAEEGRFTGISKGTERSVSHPGSLEWRVSNEVPYGWVGFGELEFRNQVPFRWLSDFGAVPLCSNGGETEVTLHWAPGLPMARPLFFEAGGTLVKPSAVVIDGDRTVIRIPTGASGRMFLRWGSRGMRLPGDARRPMGALTSLTISQDLVQR
ncbi:MAG: hypothetical protein KF805_02760 [Phycisphaeraceae bacterium]|nr:hypothetical protein [Phycisphaeraceae bacterium]